MPKPNDTQAILLAHAARDEAGSFYPLPETRARASARIAGVLTSLVKAGLAEEREPDDISQIWREDGDLRFGLFITAAGLEAIGIERKETFDVSMPSESKLPVRTKVSSMLSLLRRPSGATGDELIAATGWLPHTVRAALTGLRKKGHTITREKRDGATHYKASA